MNKIKESTSAKTALTILLISSVFWLGGINIRALIGNKLLDYDQFQFKTGIPPDRENTIFELISDSSLVIIISYAIVLVSAVWFVITTRYRFKENGWLLMSSILFFMFIPVEIYTYYLDIKFMLLFHSSPPDHNDLLRIFGERLGALGGLPVIALLCYYTIIPLVIFKPLRKKVEQKT
jgi:hypothetical protein